MEKIDTKKAYEDTYKMQEVGGSYRANVPKKLVERKARELDLDIEEFLDEYRVRVFYDNYKDVDAVFKFVEREENNESSD